MHVIRTVLCCTRAASAGWDEVGWMAAGHCGRHSHSVRNCAVGEHEACFCAWGMDLKCGSTWPLVMFGMAAATAWPPFFLCVAWSSSADARSRHMARCCLLSMHWYCQSWWAYRITA